MAATAQMLTTSTTQRSHDTRTFPSLLLVAMLALAVLTGAVAAWQLRASTTAAPAQVPGAAADPWAAYRPGGSVYAQQVPAAAGDPWAAYRPGGSVYAQQVPAAGR